MGLKCNACGEPAIALYGVVDRTTWSVLSMNGLGHLSPTCRTCAGVDSTWTPRFEAMDPLSPGEGLILVDLKKVTWKAMPPMSRVQQHAFEALKLRLGDEAMVVLERSFETTGDYRDFGWLASWQHPDGEDQGVLILEDGTMDAGGGSIPTDDPLLRWIARWNSTLINE